MDEIWKDVIGYEGLYLISSLGRLKRLYKDKPEKILKPIKGHLGYMTYTFSKSCKIKTYRIHRIVAIHFIPNPNNYPEVNHIDGNKENYAMINLEWCTRSQNMKHAHSMGLIFIDKATAVTTKLDSIKLKIIRKMRENNFTLKEISYLSGITIGTISKALTNIK